MKAHWNGFRSPLAEEIRRFVAAKCVLGRRYFSEEMALRMFDAFLVQHGVVRLEQVTPDVVDRFRTSRSARRARAFNELLGVVRRLFAWAVRQGHLQHSPVMAKPRRQTAHRIPFIMGPDDARRLLDLAATLAPRSRAPRRGAAYHAIFALMYGLGLRVGEVCRLTFGDVDFQRALLVVRGTKFGKTRLVPFGPKLAALLQRYVEINRGSHAQDAPLFSFTRRGPVCTGTISHTFCQLVRRMDLRMPVGTAPPHLHDLRRAFAVGTLLRWYRSGVDPAARLFHLATFMGHVSPSSTAVYLTITSELLAEADQRFHHLAAPALPRSTP